MADDAVTVTTETERGRLAHRFCGIVMRIAGVCCVAMAVWIAVLPSQKFSRPPDPSGHVAIVAWLGAAGVFVFAFPRFVTRGTWRLDVDGIVFTPLVGKSRPMKWSEIEAVRLTPGIVFRVGKRKILMNLQWETPDQWEATRRFLEARLGPNFDVFDRSPAKTSIRRLLLVSGIATIETLLWAAGLVMPLFCLPSYERWRFWFVIWLFILPMGLLIWSLAVVWRGYEKGWSRRKSSLS
jgi:hypothetical protein